MARLIGFTYGELRGKIGGNVFSRNKAGAYVRARVTPVNPQTVRQQNARYRFGTMSILYQALSSMKKDCWESFARTHFNPLKGNSTGIYSGGNAFVALRQSAGQGNEYYTASTFTQGANNYTVETLPYLAIEEPPLAPTSNTIRDTNGNTNRFIINNMALKESGEVSFNLVFPDVDPTNSTPFDSFTNAENQTFGIGFYISNTLKFEGAKPNTALKLNVADTGVVTEISKVGSPTNPVLNENIVMELASSVSQVDIRDFPCEGDIVLMTAFVRSREGAQKLIGSEYISVSAAA